MFNNTPKDEICAIAVGDFGSEVTGLFNSLGIGVTCCGDVYSALAAIIEGRRVGGKILVIGSPAQLFVEDILFL